MIKNFTFSIILLLSGSIAFAQQEKIAFEKYGVAEGLPEEFVRGLLQDKKGFMWAATQNGLVKYDGYQFKVYKVSSDIGDTASLQVRNIFGGLLMSGDGKIWIAGDSEGVGVTSFDPVTEKFRSFRLAAPSSQSFERNMNLLLFEDSEGNIWFKHIKSISNKVITCRLNPKTGAIKQYEIIDINGRNPYLSKLGTAGSSDAVWLLDKKYNLNKWNRKLDRFEIIIPAGKALSSAVKPDTLRQLVKGSADRLLLTGQHGLYIFDSKNQKIVKSYLHKAENAGGLADSLFYAIEDLRGQIWVVHRHGIISLIDPATDKISTFTYGSGSFASQTDKKEVSFFLLTAQNDEGIWFQALKNFRIPVFFAYYNFAEKSFRFYDGNFNLGNNPLPKNPGVPYLFLEDRTGMIWLGTRPGLYKQAPKKQQINLFRYQSGEPNSLPSDSISYIFEDSKKRLWIGTRNGLALYQPDKKNFRVFRNDPANKASISNNFITTIQEDADGKIWVGTRNGLNQWQEFNGSFKRFFFRPDEKNECEFLFTDKQQRLWLSLWDKGVFILDKNTGRVIKSYMPDNKNPASLTSRKIDVFYQDSRGNIWLGDAGDNQFGLYRLNQAEDGFIHYMPIPGDSTSISSNEITFLTEDGKKRLWIGTDDGLNLYDYATKRFIQYRSANSTSIQGFVLDKKGEPWFGVYSGAGMVSVNTENSGITAYGEINGLLHNDMNSGLNSQIAKDEYGRFWLPTQRGLSVFDPESKSFISYFEKDGFQPYDRRYITIKLSNGDIWIGSYHGLNHIVPANLLMKDNTLPSVVITQVAVNGSPYSMPDGAIFKQSVAYTNNFELEYWQKDLSFDFVALHYLRSEDNRYSWKLENYDQDWSAPSRERKASYTNLSPGKYVFRVKASNADGVWNEEGISISFTILPPWWRTWWAYGIYLVILTIIGWRIHKFQKERTIRIERDKTRDRELIQAKEIEKAYTDLKATQTQLIQSEKMASLGELTAGIAHEIQNPLNFVNNFSEVSNELIDEMNDELDNGEIDEAKNIAKDIKQNLEKINHHGKRADAIVKGMLQHSRSSNGVKEPTDINVLADEYLRLAYHGLRAKDKSFNATMKTEFDETIGKIDIIPQDIGRVILNLITNAFYAVDEKKKMRTLEGFKTLQGLENYEPTVSVSTKKVNDKVEISVSDTGSGIPQKVLDKIFQPFFTTKPTGQGTGLGLSLSYDIVKAHGGEIKVKTNQNEGTEFTIILPA